MGRRTALGTALVTVLLAVLLVAPAGAATASYQGTPVTPAPNALTAPVLSAGRYVVTLAHSTADSYLQVKRTIPGSTIWVGATLDMGPGTDGKSFVGDLFVNGYADGSTSHECWDDPILSTASAAIGGRDTTHFDTWLQQSNRDDPACRTAHTITLDLSPFRWTPPTGTQLQIVTWEQPPTRSLSGLQAPSDTVTWNTFSPAPTRPLRPGATWSQAPDISDASASFHLDRDSAAVFRMPLTWGQHAQALVGLQQKVTDDLPDLSVWWASPMGGAVRKPTAQDAPGDVFLGSIDGASSYAAATPTVNFRNGELALKGQPDSPSVAGDYFLVVYAGTKGVPAGGLDLTLQSGFYTDYVAVAPPWTTPPGPVTQVADFTRATGSGRAETGAERRAAGSGRPWPLVAGLGGAAVLFGALGAVGAVAVQRRRRT